MRIEGKGSRVVFFFVVVAVVVKGPWQGDAMAPDHGKVDQTMPTSAVQYSMPICWVLCAREKPDKARYRNAV